MPYFSFSGDVVLLLAASVLFLVSRIWKVRNKPLSRGAQIVATLLVWFFFVSYLSVEGFQFDFNFYESVIEGAYNADPMYVIGNLREEQIVAASWLAAFMAFVFALALYTSISIVALFVDAFCEVSSIGTKTTIFIVNFLIVALVLLTPVSLLYYVDKEHSEPKVRYLLPTSPLGDYIPKKMTEFCQGADVITLTREKLSCGSVRENVLLETIDAISKETQFPNPQPKSILVNSFELLVAYSRVGASMDDFSLEITWDSHNVAQGVIVLGGSGTPKETSINQMDEYAVLAYQGIVSAIQRLPSAKNVTVEEPNSTKLGWESAKIKSTGDS